MQATKMFRDRVTTPYSDTEYELYSRITAIEAAILQMKTLLGPHNARLDLESHRGFLEKPRWDREARELTWGGMLVREVKRPHHAKNIVAILDAFERAGWPPRIDDPLRRHSSDERRRRDVESLNKRLLRPAMRFACDGTGTGFLWRANRAPCALP